MNNQLEKQEYTGSRIWVDFSIVDFVDKNLSGSSIWETSYDIVEQTEELRKSLGRFLELLYQRGNFSLEDIEHIVGSKIYGEVRKKKI